MRLRFLTIWLLVLSGAILVACDAGPSSLTSSRTETQVIPLQTSGVLVETNLPTPVHESGPRNGIVYGDWLTNDSGENGIFKIVEPTTGQDFDILLPGQPHAGNPEWSPTGEWILYSVYSGTDEQSSLWLIGTESSSVPRRLTPDYNCLDGGKWSFDEHYVAFRMTDEETDTENVIVLDVNTGQTNKWLRSWGYAWAPTGPELAVLSDDPAAGLYIINVETNEEKFFPAVKTANPLLVWAPEGEEIAFVDSITDTLVYHIRTLNVETGAYRTFLSGQDLIAQSIWALSWSPTGEYILFQGQMQQECEPAPGAMYLLDVSTGETTKLVEEVEAAVWSPDGLKIAYILSINVQRPNQLYNIEVSTGKITQLTDNPYSKDSLSWR